MVSEELQPRWQQWWLPPKHEGNVCYMVNHDTWYGTLVFCKWTSWVRGTEPDSMIAMLPREARRLVGLLEYLGVELTDFDGHRFADEDDG